MHGVSFPGVMAAGGAFASESSVVNWISLDSSVPVATGACHVKRQQGNIFLDVKRPADRLLLRKWVLGSNESACVQLEPQCASRILAEHFLSDSIETLTFVKMLAHL